jgi:hypothetical protein
MCVASGSGITVNNALELTQREAVMICFKLPSCWLDTLRKITKKKKLRVATSVPRFEPGT